MIGGHRVKGFISINDKINDLGIQIYLIPGDAVDLNHLSVLVARERS